MTKPRIPESARTGICWPALPEPRVAALLALQHQFDQSQWWAPETLLDAQLRQLELVLAHAAETVPFYRGRLEAVAHLRPGELTLDSSTEADFTAGSLPRASVPASPPRQRRRGPREASRAPCALD